MPLIQVTSGGQRSLLKKKLQVCESQQSCLFVGDQILIFHHQTDIETYIGLLILCGVYKSRNENVASLWDADTGRANICKAHAKFICESCE